jgi:hypothetical protein
LLDPSEPGTESAGGYAHHQIGTGELAAWKFLGVEMVHCCRCYFSVVGLWSDVTGFTGWMTADDVH